MQDYEHVTLLWERFKEFAKETELMGSERVSTVNQIADSLISAGHTDAATIAQWKDALNDAWADLGELIDTRYLSAYMYFFWPSNTFFFAKCKDLQLKSQAILFTPSPCK